METTKNSIQRLGILTGLFTSLILACYFLLMKVFGLAQIVELRYLNFFILFGGILYAYRHFRQPGHNIEYLPGIGLGILTAAASVIPFAVFMYAYFTFLDPALLETIKNGKVVMGDYITPFAITGTVIMEGLSSGAIISFALMQYYKSGFEKSEIKNRRKKWSEGYLNS